MKQTYYRAFSQVSKRWMQFWNQGDLVEAAHYAREKLAEPLRLIEVHPEQEKWHDRQDQCF